MKLPLATLLLGLAVSCSTPLNSVEKLYGSECVIVLTPSSGPQVTIMHQHDLGLSPTSTRMMLEVVASEDDLELGGGAMENGVKYQLILFDPFTSAQRAILRNTNTGETKDVEFIAESADPNPVYGSATVVTEAEGDTGTWVHVHFGDEAEHGVRVLVAYA